MPLERCIVCDEPTGKAGRADDSLYGADGLGPYCEEHFDKRHRADLAKCVENVRAIFQLDRCDYCRWPIAADRKDGCTENDCSMRPRPGPDAASVRERQALRSLLRAIAALTPTEMEEE